MAAPVTGPVSFGPGGGVQMVFLPPIEFILKQTGEFRRLLDDLDPLWDAFSAILPGIFRRHFESRGGGEWPELAESTIRQKARGGYPDDPMIRTGNLLSELVSPSNAVDRSRTQMSWGVDAEYAAYHQRGDGNLPQREVIPDPMRVDDRMQLEAAVVAYINVASLRSFGQIRAA